MKNNSAGRGQQRKTALLIAFSAVTVFVVFSFTGDSADRTGTDNGASREVDLS